MGLLVIGIIISIASYCSALQYNNIDSTNKKEKNLYLATGILLCTISLACIIVAAILEI